MPAFLVQTTVKATIVLVAAWLLTRAMGRSSAAARHFVWTLAIVAALMLPVIELAAPRWNVPILPAASAAHIAAPAARPSGAPVHGVDMPPGRSVTDAPAAPPFVGSADSRLVLAHEISWVAVAMAVWVAGLAVILARLAAGLAWISRITREAADVGDLQWTTALNQLAAAFGITTPVSLKVSQDATIPVTCGIRRPTILLPAEALAWADDRRNVVLLHELAHIARRDCLVQAIARVACAVHWFNPFAHLAATRLRAEQERAADDLVLAAGTDAPTYADHLFELARTFRAERYPTWATLAMARPSQIGGRVMEILDDRRNRRPPARAARVAVAASATALLLPVGALHLTAAPASNPPSALPAAIVAQADEPPPLPEALRLPEALPLPEPPPNPSRAANQAPSRPQDTPVSDETRRRVADALLLALNDDNEEVREQALVALAGMRDPRAIPGLLKALRDASADVREHAINALAQFDTPEAIDGFVAALTDQNADVRERAARAIGALGARGRLTDPKYVAIVAGLLKDPAPDVRMQAIAALRRIGRQDAVPLLLPMLKDMDKGVRELAADALGDIGDPRAIDALTAALKDAEPEVRQEAASALGRIVRGEQRARPAVVVPPVPKTLPLPPRPQVKVDVDAINQAVRQAHEALQLELPAVELQQLEIYSPEAMQRRAEELQREVEKLVR
jgi:HEAT repeat protein/beta-lactamase regulating signal transducer with metallopeptidase domain